MQIGEDLVALICTGRIPLLAYDLDAQVYFAIGSCANIMSDLLNMLQFQ